MRRIVGIMLVQNEDRFVERAARNVQEFCDELLFADNGSTDETSAILQKIAAQDSRRCRYRRTVSAAESHEMLAPYIGTGTWVFRVDGDEIYDPQALASLRARLLAGDYDAHWVLLGNMLNCVELDEAQQVARGYLSPPSRPGTNLYNFRAITAWPGPCRERLHGGAPRFVAGYHAGLRHALHEEWSWDESLCRCLHVCFLRRSSMETAGRPRLNVQEQSRGVLGWLRATLGLGAGGYKNEKYRRGELVAVSTEPFFR